MEKSLKSNLLTGGVLIVVGVLFILHNLEMVELRFLVDFWPFLLIFLGIPKLMQFPSPKVFTDGLWLVFLGLWLYISLDRTFGFGFSRSWPLVIVMAGIAMIVKNALRSMNRRKLEESYGQ